MNKVEWDKLLEIELRALSYSDAIKIKEYYTEIYFDKLDNGERESNIIAGFGDPKEIVERIKNTGDFNLTKPLIQPKHPWATGSYENKTESNTHQTNQENSSKADSAKINQKSKSKLRSNWVLILIVLILSLPMILPFLGIFIGIKTVFLAILITVMAIIVSLMIIGVTFVPTGIIVMIGSLTMFETNFEVALVHLGAGAILFGIGLIMLVNLKGMVKTGIKVVLSIIKIVILPFKVIKKIFWKKQVEAK